MNDILIVGNGYDLAKGLKTRFSDFFLPIVYQYVVCTEEKNKVELLDKTEDLCLLIKNHLQEFSEPKVSIKDKDVFFTNIFIKIILNSFFPFTTVLDSLVSINQKLSIKIYQSKYFDPLEAINADPDLKLIIGELSKVKKLLKSTKANTDFFLDGR